MTNSRTESTWQWRPDWRIWTLALVLLPVLISLGFWQLDRAQQAAEEQTRWETVSEDSNWPPAEPARGQPVSLAGQYQPQYQWLLDNRTRDGRRGYELLQLFQPVTGEPLVINRGWLPAPATRDQLPTVATPEAPVVIDARLADWPQPPTMGASDPADSSGWPQRVQTLSQSDVRKHIDPVSSYTVRLADSDQPGALLVDWSPTSMGVASHRGYALQWFSLAVVLLTLTIATSFRKDPTSEDTDDQNDRSTD